MRSTIIAVAALIVTAVVAGPAPAQWTPKAGPVIRDHRSLPDLRASSLIPEGRFAKLSVVNVEGSGNNKATKFRIQMHKWPGGIKTFVGEMYGRLPVVPAGDFRVAYAYLPYPPAGCTLTCDLDVNNQLAELNEGNNRTVVNVPR